MMLEVDLVIKLVELVAIIGGGGVFMFKMGRAVSKFETVSTRQADDIAELKMDFKAMAEATLQLALQDQRMTNMSQRITATEELVNELRHGEGFVYPLGSHLGNAKP